MIAVIFEVWPADGKSTAYLDLSNALKVDLQKIDGFISVERFESIAEPGKLLSLSFFRDEASVEHWRNRPAHRTTQQKGRTGVFENYRLRVASVVRDYGMNERDQAPQDSQLAHMKAID